MARGIVAMTCPKCHVLMTEKRENAFVCRKCKLLWEPPDGFGHAAVSSPLEPEPKPAK